MTQTNHKRSVTISNDCIDEQARTVTIAFSSDTPYQRFAGNEILKHEPSNVRMERLENNAALLLDHDWSKQIGVVERAWLEEGKGRAVVRFGKGSLANEIFNDVVDGIRQHISVGYTVHDIQPVKNDEKSYHVTDWEPLEISIVSVPADTSVGVGRELETQSKQTKELTMTTQEPKAPFEINQDGLDSERKRVTDILSLAKLHNFESDAETFIKSGKSVDGFKTHILDSLHKKSAQTAIKETPPTLGLNDSEAQQFSFQRAIAYLVDPHSKKARENASFEIEVSEAAQQKGIMQPTSGIAIPFEVLSRSAPHSMTGLEGDNSNTSATIKQNYLDSSFIELLTNRSIALQLATGMNNLVGEIKIPKQTKSANTFWVGEGEEGQDSQIEVGFVTMKPHTAGVSSLMTKELLFNSASNIESIIRRDMATQAALGLDTAALYGSGGKQPVGLKNIKGIHRFSYTDAMSFADFVELESIIASQNADVNSMVLLMNPTDYSKTKITPRGNGIQAPIVDADGKINGYRVEISNQIIKGEIFFGNFSDLLVGTWGGIDLTVDAITMAKKRMIQIFMHQNVDFAIRHDESFVIANSAAKKGLKS